MTLSLIFIITSKNPPNEWKNVEPLKILKHVSTRRLSLQTCITRILHHWPALKSYFNSHQDVEKEGRVKSVAKHLMNPEMILYFQFLEFILSPLNEFNTAFRANAAKIEVLHEQITRLLRKFSGKFVKVKCISSCKDICDVNYHDRENQLKFATIGDMASDSEGEVDFPHNVEREQMWASTMKLNPNTASELIRLGFDSMEAISMIEKDDMPAFNIPLGQQKVLMRAVRKTFKDGRGEAGNMADTHPFELENEATQKTSARIQNGGTNNQDGDGVNNKDGDDVNNKEDKQQRFISQTTKEDAPMYKRS
ncbi:unnamed protein product [Mytilus coruscus]|uniref:Uncharacterized protein n=1 Tax=Mytilus coruscus TaxID=42192 RepID=A0A6J8B0I0_MYTCO|nr:unnamed protein product [Mytilus coruscus]